MAQALADQGASETGVAGLQPREMVQPGIQRAALLQDAGKNRQRGVAGGKTGAHLVSLRKLDGRVKPAHGEQAGPQTKIRRPGPLQACTRRALSGAKQRGNMTAFDLTGKVALVTGGNGGIGLGMAKGLIQAGAAVMVAGRDPEKNRRAVEALGGNADAVALDLALDSSGESAVAATVRKFGRLDIVVNNAGTNI